MCRLARPTSSGPRELPRFPLGWHKPTWDELREYRGKALALHVRRDWPEWLACEVVGYDEAGRNRYGDIVDKPTCWVELRPGSRMEITNLSSLAIPGKDAGDAGQRRHG